VRRTTVDGRPAYTPAQGAAEWAAGQMRAVLDRSGDRSAILHRFVSSLDPAGEQILRAALREHRPDSAPAAGDPPGSRWGSSPSPKAGSGCAPPVP